jgi:hypothetical protein
MSVRRTQTPWFLSKPALITAGIAALGAAGTAIVKLADYIKLPDVVAQEAKRNDTQDQRLDKLITLQEYQQQQRPNQAPNRSSSPGLREWDDTNQTMWCCQLPDRNACFDQTLWRRCD